MSLTTVLSSSTDDSGGRRLYSSRLDKGDDYGIADRGECVDDEGDVEDFGLHDSKTNPG